ncbi:helix-turn-helix domain-containing protein [Nonomuraea thailandensis]
MSLGERLDQELQRQGKTQVALAEAVGVSPATVSQWRAGSKKPSVANVIKIGEWLSISPAWLQFGDDPAPSRPVNEKDRAAYQRDCIWYYRSAPNDQGRELGSAAGFVFEGASRRSPVRPGRTFWTSARTASRPSGQPTP